MSDDCFRNLNGYGSKTVNKVLSEGCKAYVKERQVGGSHYSKFTIQPADFINKNNLSYFQGNVIKYVVRYKDKNGKEDLLKAMHYLEMMLDEYGEDQ